jgi:hypothetical protein
VLIIIESTNMPINIRLIKIILFVLKEFNKLNIYKKLIIKANTY